MQILEIFLWGIFGGLSAEAAGFFAIRHLNPNDFPYWVKSRVSTLCSYVSIVANYINLKNGQ